MILKNISKTKLLLAFISLVITFFVWQQGLRDSLSRPSVSFDISQKEQEIVELAVQSIPTNLKKFFITNDPVDQINNSLSQVSFNELSERNKLIRIISSESNDPIIYKNTSKDFENKGETTSPKTTNPPAINKTISINSKSKDLISFHPNFFKEMVVHNIFKARIEPISIVKSGISLMANIFKNILLENDLVINALSSKSTFLLIR